MTLSLQPAQLARYRDIARLAWKYGRTATTSSDALAELVAEGGEPIPTAAGAATGEGLAADLEALGPTFVKLGQVLATRADLLPISYLEALARLQDKVAPFDYGEVERIVESELGVRISKAFSSFDPTPLAAASLGQVHRAALRDGRPVVVKVQRPEVRELIAADLAALEQIAATLERHTQVGRRYDLVGLVAEFRRSLVKELDYRLEAQNLVRLGANLARFQRLLVPQPIDDYTTSRVLTMDYVRGTKVTSIGPLARLDLDAAALADELFHAYLHQVLVDGFFHADPHPGNVFLTDDGRLALLDLGMVGRVSPELQDRLLHLLLAISRGQGEEVASIVEGIGLKLSDFDAVKLRQLLAPLVADNETATIQQLAIGRLMLGLSHGAAGAGLRVPPELALLGKTLLHLDEIGRCLEPSFDPNAALRRHAAGVTSERLRKGATPSHLLATLGDMKDFVEQLPGRANKILDKVANNELRVRVDALDEQLLMEGFQKVANRITVGLVLAALILGAALLMNVPSNFRLLGYPGLAIVCFLGAAAGGVLLVLSILWNDRRSRNRPGRG
jgi:predicted unusual protein kinase regulating ubiquinone biosynthesis (AarF/ABC1/UbiB family)